MKNSAKKKKPEMIAWMTSLHIDTTGFAFIASDDHCPKLTQSWLKTRVNEVKSEFNYKFNFANR